MDTESHQSQVRKFTCRKCIRVIPSNMADGSAPRIIIYEESHHFGPAARSSQFGAGTHIQHHTKCPAEGQSLQRGHVRDMPVFSLMTQSAINTPRLSRSARVCGSIYWLLALVPWRILSRPADHLPDRSWTHSSSTHAQCSGGQQADTHSSTEGPVTPWKSPTQVIFSL